MTVSDKKLISVIVPVYNSRDYLPESIQSILAQTYPFLEVILVDDGSTDGSAQICDDFSVKDNRVSVIHKTNGGQSEARNCGLDAASGEYIGFVDSDDTVEPEIYEKLLGNMLKENAQISCCGTKLVFQNGSESFYCSDKSLYKVYSGREALAAFTDNKLITGSLCDKLFSRSVFEDLRLKKGSIYEDYLAVPYCLLKAERIVYTAKPLYNYRYTPQSTMRGHRSLRLYDIVPVCAQLVDLYREVCPEALAGMKNQYIDHCLTLFYVSYGDPAWDEKRKELLDILSSVDKKTCSGLYWDNRIKLKLLNAGPERYVRLYRKLQDLKAKIGK